MISITSFTCFVLHLALIPFSIRIYRYLGVVLDIHLHPCSDSPSIFLCTTATSRDVGTHWLQSLNHLFVNRLSNWAISSICSCTKGLSPGSLYPGPFFQRGFRAVLMSESTTRASVIVGTFLCIPSASGGLVGMRGVSGGACEKCRPNSSSSSSEKSLEQSLKLSQSLSMFEPLSQPSGRMLSSFDSPSLLEVDDSMPSKP